MHLAAVLLRHAAPGRQGAIVAIATVCLEAQLLGRALRRDELERPLLLQDGAVVAAQALTEQRGEEEEEEEVEAPRSSLPELQHVQPARTRQGEHLRSTESKVLHTSLKVEQHVRVKYTKHTRSFTSQHPVSVLSQNKPYKCIFFNKYPSAGRYLLNPLHPRC